MALHSQPDALGNSRKILDAQLRELLGRVVYSHKVHEKEADILLAKLSKIKLGQIVLPAISTGGFLSMLAGTGWWGSSAGSICSAMLLALNLYTRNYDLGKLAQEHRDAAIKIWSIREKYLSLVTDLAVGCEQLSVIQGKRDALVDELGAVYANSPRTTEGAYRKARKALKLQEEITFSEAEVDAFLPPKLRRT